jgi:asparagine synthase (glutamine-hydrolysing)
MSSVLGIFPATPRPADESIARAQLARMRRRGADRAAVRMESDGTLAVARMAWELEPGFSGDVLIADEDHLLLAADATLYYRKELEHKLAAAGSSPRSQKASDLILAAYRAWGERCTDELEGDFAFILWDRRSRRVFCARDFGGKRPLHYADLGDTLIVASTVSAILAHPDCPDDLDLAVIAATASGLFTALGADTSYKAIKVLPAGCSLSWRPGTPVTVTPHWEPFRHWTDGSLPFESAAEELRATLGRAVRERLAPSGPTTVWMSGGFDSTAVFAASQKALRADPHGRRLIPVSISYPDGDPGREDELISMVADYWGAPVHWLKSSEIRLLDGAAERAANRDQPATHLYEVWNEALARGSRACGTRVALDGNGGDQLFQVSNVYLSDLFLNGRWISLAREWQTKRAAGWKEFVRWAVLPTLPHPIRATAAFLRGNGELRSYLERPIPAWIRNGVVDKDELRERQRRDLPKDGLSSRAESETNWYLTSCISGLGLSYIASTALAVGVELRSPLYDRRIVEFALSRPRHERNSVAGTKHLLRRAMKDLLPAEFLAPRASRTGITSGYSRMWMKQRYPQLFGDLFRRPLILEELGLIDSVALRRSLDQFQARGGEFTRVNLFHTLQTELWLRARAGRRSDMKSVLHGMEPAPLGFGSPAAWSGQLPVLSNRR